MLFSFYGNLSFFYVFLSILWKILPTSNVEYPFAPSPPPKLPFSCLTSSCVLTGIYGHRRKSLPPAPNKHFLHALFWEKCNSKATRNLMVIEGGGTLFHQYSKFKSEKYPWLHILWETMWKTYKNFFTLECKTWQNVVIFIPHWLKVLLRALNEPMLKR